MKRLVPVFIALALLPLAASADHSLNGHSAAMAGWTGQAAFYAYDPSDGDTLDAVVDYAVFAPGDWVGAQGNWARLGLLQGGPLPGYNPQQDYVYAYQIYNENASTSPLSNVVLHSMGLNVMDIGTVTDIAHDAMYCSALGGVDPYAARLTSAGIDYLFGGISPARHSTILLFTSPNTPVLCMASLQNGGTSDSDYLPSPVPVPGAVVLGVVGLGIVTAVKRRLG